MTSEVRKFTTNQTFFDEDTNTTAFVFWANLTSDGRYGATLTALKIGNGPYMMTTGIKEDTDLHVISVIEMIFLSPRNSTKYKASRCSIFPSINTYGVEIRGTILRETLLESAPLGTNMLNQTSSTEIPDLAFAWKHATKAILNNGTKQECARRTTPSPGFSKVIEPLLDPVTLDEKLRYPKENMSRIGYYYPEDCIYRFGSNASVGIAWYLKRLFGSQQMYFEHEIAGTSGSIHLLKLFREVNITLDTVKEFMTDLTTSMTAVVKTHGQEGKAAYATGKVWYTTTGVRVKWAWISYPVAIIALSAVFLVLVQIESRGVGSERLWKSSVLATLSCEVDDAITQQAQPAQKRDMRDLASSTSVSLDLDTKTPRLVAR